MNGLDTNGHRRPGIPHVTGVVTEGDETIAADLVVDTSGRRSALPAWLDAIDARQPTEERDDSGFVYYGRHFRSTDGSVPPCENTILTHYDSMSILTLPADNGSWGVGLVTSARDKELRSLRATTTWERALAEYPMAAHWMDGEAISDGGPYETDDPVWQITKAWTVASSVDSEVYRAFVPLLALQSAPEEALAAPGLLDRIIAA